MIHSLGSVGTLLPYHHTVSNDFLPHIKHLFDYKNENQFTRDVDFLLKYYKPISVPDLTKFITDNAALPKNTFLLSFDDGLKEIYTTIAPILLKKGVPAYFFINPSFIDNKDLFYRYKISLLINELLANKESNSYLKTFNETLGAKNKSLQQIITSLKKITNLNTHLVDTVAEKIGYSFADFLETEQPFVTQADLKSLHKDGFTIGAHSMDHPYYNLLHLPDQIKQTAASCKYVNDLLGITDSSFSFPHTDDGISQDFFNQLNNYNIPLFFGTQNQKMEIKNKMLHRFNAERPEVNFSAQIKGLTTMIWLKTLVGKNKIVR